MPTQRSLFAWTVAAAVIEMTSIACGSSSSPAAADASSSGDSSHPGDAEQQGDTGSAGDSSNPSDASNAGDTSTASDSSNASDSSEAGDAASCPSQCDPSSCNASTQYCTWLSDGMGNGGGGCMSIPPACAANPTCPCLLSVEGGAAGSNCTCTITQGVFSVSCC